MKGGNQIHLRMELFTLFRPQREKNNKTHTELEFLVADLNEEFTIVGAIEVLENETLDVLGVALIKPKVLPRGVGYEVARPRVRDLVGDSCAQRPVASL